MGVYKFYINFIYKIEIVVNKKLNNPFLKIKIK